MLRKNRKNSTPLLILLLIIAVAGSFSMTIYDNLAPKIFLKQNTIYTNLKEPIYIDIEDDKALKSVKVVLIQGNKIEPLLFKSFDQEKKTNLKIELPQKLFSNQNEPISLLITANDKSWYNLFFGNESKKRLNLVVDNKPPFIDIISNSYRIEQGGSGAVVFKASDKNLSELFIQSKAGRIFKVSPYLKKGYYAALIAWDLKQEEFRAYIIATDKAGNVSKKYIPYFLRNLKYRNSNIKLSEHFLNGKIKALADIYAPKNNHFNYLEKFKFINEDLRNQNEALIYKLSSDVSSPAGKDYKISAFYPLKNAMQVASFGDHRFYMYDNIEISQSYHLGLDLASVAKAPIVASNAGRVVFAGENGIYGLNIIIDHGFGLFSLYGHCSSKEVKVGDMVKAGDIIAHTGTSGLALGDHVHFGVLIGSQEVRPSQFQDKKWLDDYIIKVLNQAKKIILSE